MRVHGGAGAQWHGTIFLVFSFSPSVLPASPLVCTRDEQSRALCKLNDAISRSVVQPFSRSVIQSFNRPADPRIQDTA